MVSPTALFIYFLTPSPLRPHPAPREDEVQIPPCQLLLCTFCFPPDSPPSSYFSTASLLGSLLLGRMKNVQCGNDEVNFFRGWGCGREIAVQPCEMIWLPGQL